jgi:molybdopterin synthase sulfur carrier subunit
MKLKYFAWVRERIGKAEETVEPPAKPKVIRAAIDHAHVKTDAMIAGAREIAFFPPMTGG